MLKQALFIALAALLPLAAENSFELNLNDDDIEVSGKYELTNLGSYAYDNKNYLHASYIYSGESKTRGKHLGEFGYLATGYVPNFKSLLLGVGLKGVVSSKYISVPLGLVARYEIPVDWPLFVSVKGYVAPNPLTYYNGESYYEFRSDISAKIIDNAQAYGGFRHIETRYKDNSKTFNNNWLVGVRFFF